LSSQRRSARNRALPTGVRERAGYYTWTNPQNGQELGLGRDRARAIAEAIEANNYILGLTRQVRLVDRLTGESDRTVGAWADIYAQQLEQRDHADQTRRTNATHLRRTRADLGDDTAISRITTRDIAGAIGKLRAQEKKRMAQSFRSFLKDFFRAAMAEGWIESNPVLVTEAVAVEVQRARLTLDIFLAVRMKAQPWLKNAMDLALISAQRREDIADAQFTAFHDAAWYCEQGKTKNKVCIPYSLRLDVIGMSLGDIVTRCQSSGIRSKHLIHQTHAWGNSPVGSQIWRDTITRHFSKIVTTLGHDFGARTSPTFHEIRSLAERLYKAQGNVDTQELLGHRDPRMTQIYHNARGAEWVHVKVG
jgi:integrase